MLPCCVPAPGPGRLLPQPVPAMHLQTFQPSQSGMRTPRQQGAGAPAAQPPERKCVTAPRGMGYTGLVTSHKGVSGFGDPCNRCDASRSSLAVRAASLSAPPVLVARRETRKGLPVRASGSRFANPSSHRPRLATGAVVVANRTAWRPFMAQSASRGASAPRVTAPTSNPAPTFSKTVARLI